MRSHIRESTRSGKAWTPIGGVCLLGVLAFGLSLEGSSVPGAKEGSTKDRTLMKSSFEPDVVMANTPRALPNDRLSALRASDSARISTIPKDTYPIGPTYVVDPYNDIGNQWRAESGQLGPIPLRTQAEMLGIDVVSTGGGGECTFAIDCDDGNPCTNDRCDIAPGGAAGTGTCVNDPVENGESGDCDDGIFCNGEETCEGGAIHLCQGTCAGGPNQGQLCETDAGNQGCPDSFCVGQICQSGPNMNNVCTYHQDCASTLGTCTTGGNPCPGDGDPVGATACSEAFKSCQEPCSLDADCDDGLKCNGAEACQSRPQFGGGSALVCVPGDPPCGDNATCLERRCLACGSGCNGRPCESNLDCVGTSQTGTCTDTNPPDSGCFEGRCCDGLDCTPHRRFASVQPADTGCAFDWYAGDSGQLAPGATCADPSGPALCPVYGAGIIDGSNYTVVAGPASLSPANNIMSGTPIYKLGDDYDFTGAGVGSNTHLALAKFRFVGGVSAINHSRISFEFYDENGAFVEDLFFISEVNQASVQLVLFDPPLVIPPKGFIVAHVLQAFGNINVKGQMFWVAADQVDEGINDTSTLWVVNTDLDDAPVEVANFLKRCSGGLNAGAQCGVNGDCDSNVCEARGNDVLAFELEGNMVPAPVGACCGMTPGVCNELSIWDCRGSGGSFLGNDTLCNSCSLDSPFFGDGCTVDADCQECDGNSGVCAGEPCSQCDCAGNGGACIAVGTCEANTACNVGACCLEDGLCLDGQSEASCTGASGEFQGFGTTCEPNCCRQPETKWTGADNCDDAIVNVINVPCLTDADCGGVFSGSPAGVCDVGSGTCEVTITGNNAGASSTPQICIGGTEPGKSCNSDLDCGGGGTCAINICIGGANDGGVCASGLDCPAACEGGSNDGNACGDDLDCPSGKCGPAGICQGNPDPCNPPVDSAGAELGWWQAFSIDDCAFVRVDHCCTDPVKIPAYRILYSTCPCGQAIFTKRDPNEPNEPPDARGAPYCATDNAWQKFGPLPAGTYYYPILSFLGGNFEEYQFHITTKPCPAAACCYNACSDSSGGSCTVNADCPSGERCVINRDAQTASCQRICEVDGDCGGTCDPSCDIMNALECAALGGAFLAPPNRSEGVTECGTICDTGSCCTGPGECVDEETGIGDTITKPECDSLDGSYVGGFRCFGGTCSGGDRDGLSCAADSQCPNGGVCSGGEQDLAQPSPCPVCQIIGGDNCQLFNDGVGSRDSDLSVSGASRQADDFEPQGNQITTVCFWGTYAAPDEEGSATDCSLDVSDSVTVTIYPADPSNNDLPDNGAGVERVINPNNLFRAEQVPSTLATLTNRDSLVYAYQGVFDPPISVTPGETYWLEIRNDTAAPAGNNCIWSWMTISATAFNDYSAVGGPSGYTAGSARTTDFSWCMDVNMISPEAPTSACCKCDGTCATTTKRECDNQNGSWQLGVPCGSCPVLPQANDNCSVVIAGGFEPGGTIVFDNNCTSTDGPNPTPSELGSEALANDVWYKYQATCDGVLTISTCPTGAAAGGGLDTFLAVYTLDCGSPTCPATSAEGISRLWPNGTGWDENCNGLLDGSGGFAEGAVTTGDCFLIRVGGFAGQGSETGQGIVTIECVEGAALPDPVAPGDTTVRNRYVGAQIPDSVVAGASPSAVQVCIQTMTTCSGGGRDGLLCRNAGDCPSGSCVSSPRVGECWWAGQSANIPNGSGPTLVGAPMVCESSPSHSQVWPTGDLYFHGPFIVPGSEYAIRNCTPDGSSCTAPLIRPTATWGDVVSPFGTPNFGDISAILDKFRGLANPPLVSANMIGPGPVGQPNTIDTTVNFADVSAGLDAFRGLAFAFGVASCP
jgi:hypothetical protein